MGEFFQNDFKQFEIQIMKVIEGYYLYKKNEQLSFIDNKIKTQEKIIEYLKDKNNESLIDKINEKGIYDLPNLLNICQNFFEDLFQEKYKEKKNIFHFNLSKRISSEIIDFRNHFAHTDKINSEYILRLYENFYFYLKIVCVPEIKDVYTEYFKKDLNIYIKQALEINIQKPTSFQLFFNMENSLNNFKNEEPINNCDLLKKDIEYLYNYLIPTTFPTFKFQESEIQSIRDIEDSINESMSVVNESKLVSTNTDSSIVQSNLILSNSSNQSLINETVSKENNGSNSSIKENEDIYVDEEEEDYSKIKKIEI